MNFGFQKQAISNMIKRKGYDPDLYDLDSHIDRSLTLQENMNNIGEDIKFMSPISRKQDRRVTSSSISKTDRYLKAVDCFENRSNRQQRSDGRKQARTTFEMHDLNKKNFGKWKRNPNRYDIQGVDSRY